MNPEAWRRLSGSSLTENLKAQRRGIILRYGKAKFDGCALRTLMNSEEVNVRSSRL